MTEFDSRNMKQDIGGKYYTLWLPLGTIVRQKIIRITFQRYCMHVRVHSIEFAISLAGVL